MGLTTRLWPIAVVLMGILSPIGILAYSYLRQKVENVLFQEQQRYQEAIKDLARRMTQIRELNRLFSTIMEELIKLVKPQFIGLYFL